MEKPDINDSFKLTGIRWGVTERALNSMLSEASTPTWSTQDPPNASTQPPKLDITESEGGKYWVTPTGKILVTEMDNRYLGNVHKFCIRRQSKAPVVEHIEREMRRRGLL